MKKLTLLLVLIGCIFSSDLFAASALVLGRYCSWGAGFHRTSMQQAVKAAYRDCASYHCEDPKLVKTVAGGGYNAVAIGKYRHHCQIGYALNQWTVQQAIQIALTTCHQTGKGSCTIIKTWRNF